MISLLRLFSELNLAFPDMLLILASFILIILKNFLNGKCLNSVFPKVSLILSLILLIVVLACHPYTKQLNTELFVYSSAIEQIKTCLFVCLCAWFSYIYYMRSYEALNANFFILIYGIANAINLSISANNFVTLIIALELYTFSVGFLLLNDCNDTSHRKCAIRFLLTSAVMSAILIFGCSLLYFHFGSLSFSNIKVSIGWETAFGSVLVLCAMLFKLGGAPFHSWMLDVYEKSSSIVVLLFEAIWKFFMVFIFMKIVYIFMGIHFFKVILKFSAIITMLLGAIMPIFQKGIHRFIASVAVGHVGFIVSVVPIAKAAPAIMTYMGYQSLAVFCFLSGILLLKKYRTVVEFGDLSGIMKAAPTYGALMLFSMCALCGVPPFGNFFAKLNIFTILLESKNYLLLVIASMYSIISIAYVIKWIRFFFKSPGGEQVCVGGKPAATVLLFMLPLSTLFYGFILRLFSKIFIFI